MKFYYQISVIVTNFRGGYFTGEGELTGSLRYYRFKTFRLLSGRCDAPSGCRDGSVSLETTEQLNALERGFF